MLTQKAVSNALDKSTALHDGTPVEQMHKHTRKPVRTLEALYCAVERIENLSETTHIGLIAHPKHHYLSRQALEAVLKGKVPTENIIDIHPGKLPIRIPPGIARYSGRQEKS